jgi:hypothetical protein
MSGWKRHTDNKTWKTQRAKCPATAGWRKLSWDGIHESTSLSGILNLEILRLEVSSFVFVSLQNAIHEQTWVFFIGGLFCIDFWNHRVVKGFPLGFLLWCFSDYCFSVKKRYLLKKRVIRERTMPLSKVTKRCKQGQAPAYFQLLL